MGTLRSMSVSPEQIALSPEQKLQLARLAEQAGKPWDAVLGEALAGYRPKLDAANGNRDESFYDAAMHLGLIHSLPGGPSDLSTNPKYMEGFGERGS